MEPVGKEPPSGEMRIICEKNMGTDYVILRVTICDYLKTTNETDWEDY